MLCYDPTSWGPRTADHGFGGSRCPHNLGNYHMSQSKLLVCPSITPIVIPYVIPYISPLNSLDYSTHLTLEFVCTHAGDLLQAFLFVLGDLAYQAVPSWVAAKDLILSYHDMGK